MHHQTPKTYSVDLREKIGATALQWPSLWRKWTTPPTSTGLRPFGSGRHRAGTQGISSISYQRRAKKGNRGLKKIFYQSAYCAIGHYEKRRDYYHRKRAEGTPHNQAVVAPARRRVNVLWAMLRDGTTYQEAPPAARQPYQHTRMSMVVSF